MNNLLFVNHANSVEITKIKIKNQYFRVNKNIIKLYKTCVSVNNVSPIRTKLNRIMRKRRLFIFNYY